MRHEERMGRERRQHRELREGQRLESFFIHRLDETRGKST